MSVMIWDSAAQAFAELQNVPERYDARCGAFVDTTGKVFDRDAEAWKKVWPEKIYFYKDGIVPSGIEWGVPFSYNESDMSWKLPPRDMTLEDGKIKFSITQGWHMQLCYSSPVDLTGWNTLYADVTIEENTGGQYTPVYLVVSSDTYMDFGTHGILALTETRTSGIMELDVSGINGLAHIHLQAQNHSNTDSYRNTGYYTKIYSTK